MSERQKEKERESNNRKGGGGEGREGMNPMLTAGAQSGLGPRAEV